MCCAIFKYNALFYSKVWFNTPLLAAAERNQNMRVLGIKPDDIINFLSNEAPWQIMKGIQDNPRLASGSLINNIFSLYHITVTYTRVWFTS